MFINPLPRSNNTNWLKLHNKHCNDIINSSYSTLLIGDSLIAGLSRYPNIWRRYFKPLNAINCGIGGDRIQNVLWRSSNLPSSPFFQNAVILCDTNNIQRDSSEDIVDGILEIALSLKRKYHHLNIVVCGLLPRDVNWSVNRIYINEINDYQLYKCSLNDFNFVKPKDWTLHNGSLKPNLFSMDNLHLVEEGNMKLSESIINVIKPNKNIPTESISISSKCFNHAADLNINDYDYPLLPCNMSVRNSVPSSERVYANSIHSCKPVSVKDVRGSKFVIKFTHVNPFVLKVFVQVNPLPPVMFVHVNLFVLTMFVKVNLLVLVMFVKVNLLPLIISPLVNVFVLVILVQVNLFVKVNLFVVVMFVQVNPLPLVMFVKVNMLVLVMSVQVNLFVIVM